MNRLFDELGLSHLQQEYFNRLAEKWGTCKVTAFLDGVKRERHTKRGLNIEHQESHFKLRSA